MNGHTSDLWEEFLEPLDVECCDHGVSFADRCVDCERDREALS